MANFLKGYIPEVKLPNDILKAAAMISQKAPGLDIKKMLKLLREEYEVVLAGGQQKLDGQIFRIGHLGWVTEADIDAVLSALRMVLPQAGFRK